MTYSPAQKQQAGSEQTNGSDNTKNKRRTHRQQQENKKYARDNCKQTERQKLGNY